MLTLERAQELLATTTTEPHLIIHAKNVMAAMGGLAKHFGEDVAHWQAIGYLHDYDYEQHPEEHQHPDTQQGARAGIAIATFFGSQSQASNAILHHTQRTDHRAIQTPKEERQEHQSDHDHHINRQQSG